MKSSTIIWPLVNGLAIILYGIGKYGIKAITHCIIFIRNKQQEKRATRIYYIKYRPTFIISLGLPRVPKKLPPWRPQFLSYLNDFFVVDSYMP